MYDYISIQADSDFSISIDVNQLKKVFNDIEGIETRSHTSGVIQIGNFKLTIQGIKCDKKGNYAFNDDSIFEEINLIEINIPKGAESKIEDEIRQIATELSNQIGWEIDWRE